jgi:hypothetical protein
MIDSESLGGCHVDGGLDTRSCGYSSMRNLVFAAWAELRKASTKVKI